MSTALRYRFVATGVVLLASSLFAANALGQAEDFAASSQPSSARLADPNAASGTGDETAGAGSLSASGLQIRGSLAIDDPASVSWACCWNRTGASYGAYFNEWRGKGYRPFDFDADGSYDTRYCSVWIKNDGRGWAALRDMSSETFGENWQTFVNMGYRLVDQKAYIRNGAMNFAGIWIENRENVAWASYRNMTETVWVQRFEEFRNLGYRPHDVEVYVDTSGVKRFAAIFVANDEGVDWVALRDMTATTYAQRFAQYADEGYQVHKLHSYRVSGVQRYAAIWYRHSARAWAANRDMSVSGLSTRVSAYKGRGYRPIGITRYDYGDGYRFAAVFRQNTNSSITPPMFDEIDAFDGVLGIYAKNLSTGKSVTFSSSQSFYLASVTKVAVMAELYRRFDDGTLDRTDTRTFTEAYYREEGKRLRHARIGNVYTLDQYCEYMIDNSDTTSTDILVNHLGATNINSTIAGLNLGSFGKVTSIAALDKNIWSRRDARFNAEPNHVFEDWLRNLADVEFYELSFTPDYQITNHQAFTQYYATGLNSASPQAIGKLVEKMTRGTLWSKAASDDMLDKLRINRSAAFGSRLPSTVRTASKGGDKYQVDTEVGFIEDTTGKPLIVVAILANKVEAPDDATVNKTFGDLGLLIYEALK